jgi:hypothetical protein
MKGPTLLALGFIAATMIDAGGALAVDYCVDLRTNQVYDCNAMPPGAAKKPVAPPVNSDSKLRDQLRESLGKADPNDRPRVEQMAAAIRAAGDACARGDMAGFEAEMGKASTLANPRETDLLMQVRSSCAATRASAAAKPAPAPQPQQAVAPPPPAAAPDPNLFTTCGAADRQGVRTCYEVPPSGLACRKLLQQGGDRVWSQDMATCDSTDVLQQRNAYFANLKAPAPRQEFGADANRKQEALAKLSPQCRARLNSLLQGADSGDKEKAYTAYGGLRAQCDAEMKALASAAEVDLPERILSSRARTAMDKAMSGDPDRMAKATADRGYDAPYDMGEVIDFGLSLINLLSGFAGVYAAMPGGAAASYSGGNFHRRVYGQGAPSTPAPRYAPSTITGTTR